MISKILFRRAFWALLMTGALNMIAIKLYLYWTVWWVDMVVHFFGGMWVALISMWFLSLFFSIEKWSLKKILFLSLLSSFFVGAIWEIFELYFGLTSLSDGAIYITDTASDFLMDTMGGVFGFIQINKILEKYK